MSMKTVTTFTCDGCGHDVISNGGGTKPRNYPNGWVEVLVKRPNTSFDHESVMTVGVVCEVCRSKLDALCGRHVDVG